MDDTTFDFDAAQLGEASRRFPAHRLGPVEPRPHADLAYLAAPGTEFGRHAWDESGH